MERSFLNAIASSLLGITTLGALAFVWATPSSSKASPASPEGGWRLLDPVKHENISIFPVVSVSAQDTSVFLTLDEGLSSGEVLISEQGAAGLARTRDGRPTVIPDYNRTSASVNQLVLVNRSKRPLLLLAGELVSGGKQDRIIAKDRIVAPGSDPLPLDVFCVEHGRWSSGAQFSAAKTIVHPSVREQAAVKQDQNDVWSAVVGGTTARAASSAPAASISAGAMSEAITVEAPTQSYKNIYEKGRVGGSVESEPGVYRWRETTQGNLALIELDALQPKPMTLHRLLLHRTS
jgi:hypothetical protein